MTMNTKKITTLVTAGIGILVILLGIILFNVFYDDGFIKANKLQPGDVVTYANGEKIPFDGDGSSFKKELEV